jgi:hypothetical protein
MRRSNEAAECQTEDVRQAQPECSEVCVENGETAENKGQAAETNTEVAKQDFPSVGIHRSRNPLPSS